MDLRFSSCTLVVHDLGQALGFYRDVLGFEATEHGGRRVCVGPPSQPDVRVVLELAGSEPGVPPADREAIESLLGKGLLGHLVFVTDDCDATFEHVEAAGAEVLQEPVDQPDGVRDCVFLDPSGNLLRFTQPRVRNWFGRSARPTMRVSPIDP